MKQRLFQIIRNGQKAETFGFKFKLLQFPEIAVFYVRGLDSFGVNYRVFHAETGIALSPRCRKLRSARAMAEKRIHSFIKPFDECIALYSYRREKGLERFKEAIQKEYEKITERAILKR